MRTYTQSSNARETITPVTINVQRGGNGRNDELVNCIFYDKPGIMVML